MLKTWMIRDSGTLQVNILKLFDQPLIKLSKYTDQDFSAS